MWAARKSLLIRMCAFVPPIPKELDPEDLAVALSFPTFDEVQAGIAPLSRGSTNLRWLVLSSIADVM
jgi:hypothetical protein